MEGWAFKRGQRFGSYKKRYFVLNNGQMGLVYRESGDPSSKQKGTIDLSKVRYLSLCSDPDKHKKVGWCSRFAFELVTDTRTWTLIPEMEMDRNRWIDALIGVLPAQVVSSDLREASNARSRAATAANAAARDESSPGRVGGKANGGRKKLSASDSEEDVDYPPVTKKSPSNLRGGGRSQPAEVEMMRAEIERLRKQNEEFARAAEVPKKPSKKDGLQERLLDSDEEAEMEDDGPSCCSRLLGFIMKNIAIVVVLAVNFVLLVRAALDHRR